MRWLDRCIKYHKSSGKDDKHNLFAIVQGGLDPKLRDQCLEAMVARKDGVAGYAIGGLSGGEEKGQYSHTHSTPLYEVRFTIDVFWRMYVTNYSKSPVSRVAYTGRGY